jgi:hypothetical protein
MTVAGNTPRNLPAWSAPRSLGSGPLPNRMSMAAVCEFSIAPKLVRSAAYYLDLTKSAFGLRIDGSAGGDGLRPFRLTL